MFDKTAFGKTYRDIITGFTGVATGYCGYITGCDQLLLSPRMDEKGEYREARWFDVQRLEEVAGIDPVTIDNHGFTGADMPAPVK